jgi:hypothetical protein
MNWNNSIFSDDRSSLDSWQNRDVDGREIDQSDLMNPREDMAGWENELVDYELGLIK